MKTFELRHTVIILSALWLFQVLASSFVQIYIAARYGTGLALDVYLVGITIPNTLFMVLSSGFGIATVTYFHETCAQKGQEVALTKVTGFCLWTLAGTSLVSVLLVAAAKPLIAWLVPDFSLPMMEQTAGVLRITAPFLPFLAVFTVLQGFLQANHRFYSSSIAGIAQVSLVPIFLLFGSPATPEVLALGFNLSAAAACMILIVVAWKSGLMHLGKLVSQDFKRIMMISLPLMSAGIFTHLLWLSERHFAAHLGPGTISTLSYAQRGINLVSGALSFGLTTVLLPSLSQWLESGQHERAGLFNKKVLSLLLIPTVLCGAVLFFTGEFFIRVLLQRGEFTAHSTEMTAMAVKMYLGVLFCNIIGAVIIRNAIAAKEGVLIFFASAFLLAIYLIITPVLIAKYGFIGLPLSASIAFIASLIVYAMGMIKKHPYLYLQEKAP